MDKEKLEGQIDVFCECAGRFLGILGNALQRSVNKEIDKEEKVGIYCPECLHHAMVFTGVKEVMPLIYVFYCHHCQKKHHMRYMPGD